VRLREAADAAGPGATGASRQQANAGGERRGGAHQYNALRGSAARRRRATEVDPQAPAQDLRSQRTPLGASSSAQNAQASAETSPDDWHAAAGKHHSADVADDSAEDGTMQRRRAQSFSRVKKMTTQHTWACNVTLDSARPAAPGTWARHRASGGHTRGKARAVDVRTQ
jgi:hypothetical protein